MPGRNCKKYKSRSSLSNFYISDFKCRIPEFRELGNLLVLLPCASLAPQRQKARQLGTGGNETEEN
jgi:hypothetical protein